MTNLKSKNDNINNENDLKELFNRLDKNKDGKIEFNENRTVGYVFNKVKNARSFPRDE